MHPMKLDPKKIGVKLARKVFDRRGNVRLAVMDEEELAAFLELAATLAQTPPEQLTEAYLQATMATPADARHPGEVVVGGGAGAEGRLG
jgi:hypothetical protein